MFEFDNENCRYIFNGNRYFYLYSVVTLIMATVGVRLLIEMRPFSEGFTWVDLFGFLFICLWTGVVITAFIVGITNATKKTIISTEGVISKTLFYKREFLWPEIEDWGLSYCGNTRGEGNTYYLYFSKEPQRTKNECSKRLKGKTIKTFVYANDYDAVVCEVVSFCSEQTLIEPFVGKDKFHFWG